MFEKDQIKKLAKLYNERNEVKNVEKFILDKIVIEQLMPALGYSTTLFKVVPVKEEMGYMIQNKENINQRIGLLIKNGELTLKDENTLLDILDEKTEWGIATNGQTVVLVNKNIGTNALERWKGERKVLEIRLKICNDIKYLSYLSKEQLFEKKNTLYFKDIIEYKNNKYKGNEESWAPYSSSLKRFFAFYISEEGGRYDGYEKFQFAHFKEFVLSSGAKSPASIVNIYSHISVYLKEQIGERRNGFERSRKEVLELFSEATKEKLGDILDERRLMKINKYFTAKRNNQLRNLAIFYLSIFYGIERRQICRLRWSDIHFEKGEIYLGSDWRPLIDQMSRLLKELKVENTKKGYPGEFVFYINKKEKIYPITKDTINGIFSELEEIDKNDKVYTQYSPAKIRRALAAKLLDNMSLEDVMWFLSIEPQNLGKYLSYEEIREKAAKNVQDKKQTGKWHPMEELLDEVFIE